MPVSSYTCGAKTRSGMPCQNVPMANGRCRMHGGKSLRGQAHPNYKHGKYCAKRIGYETLEDSPRAQ